MEEESEQAASANEPQKLWGSTSHQNIMAMAKRFTESSLSFLEALQSLRSILEGQIKKEIRYASPTLIEPYGGFPVAQLWRPPQDFDYSGFTSTASETYRAWRIAKRSNSEVAEFDGESLHSLVNLLIKLRFQPMSNDGSEEADAILTLASNFKTAVVWLEELLSVKPPQEDPPLQKSPADEALSATEDAEVEAAEAGDAATDDAVVEVADKLPFGLQLCDVPQSLKRAGYKDPVTIRNDCQWKLMKALMEASPNAVPETKLKHLLQYGHRDNASRRLNDIIHDLHLICKKWTLEELDD